MQLNTVYKSLKWNAVLTALLCGLLFGGCDGTGRSQPPPQAPEVAVVTVQPQKIVLTTKLPGRTSAFRIAQIRPQVSGLIQRRLFTEGSDVKAGQALYQIDSAPFQAALDSAKAALSRSEANLSTIRPRVERYRELLADKAVSRQDYDDAAAALKQTEADIEYWRAMAKTARINLRYTRITAPISGRIGRSIVTEGAIVMAYQPVPLATIQQLDPIYVDVSQSTTELQRLRHSLEHGRLDQNGKNQKKVNLILDNSNAYPLQGTLQFRDVTVDPMTGSVILRVVFPNPEGVLLPGMFVRAIIREGINKQAILIPQQGVSRDHKGNPVSLIVDAEGKVRQRILTLDRAMGNQWLVASGLAAGDRVIVEGMQRLRPGTAVKVVPFKEGETKRAAPEKTARPTAESN
ncbi:MAG: efflux RND transporter periplasmic adaptor subunit [Thermodesulfobacteriota bacterium]|nr:efflux RND transporter periplasmic adaptor subunit [Thermodesulfobacteriota bacterium]